MNRARLEWVMSGLRQYALTAGEDLFLKTVSAEFDKSQELTAHQEERLETLYKEKSKLIPNKKSNPLSFAEVPQKKTKPQIRRGRVF